MSLKVVITVLEEVVTRQSCWYIKRVWVHLFYLTSSHTFIYVRSTKKTNDMSMSVKDEKILSEINNSDEESESCDYKWSKNSWFINYIDIETSLSHQ